MRRSDQRRDAVFALYQRDVTGRPLEELLVGARPFTRELAEATDAEAPELDEQIARLSRGWELERIAQLERSIMRVALHEMRDPHGAPIEVAIDEAVNLAKEYCGADAPAFVNGILGSAARESEERPPRDGEQDPEPGERVEPNGEGEQRVELDGEREEAAR